MSASTLILMRHAESTGNAQGIWQGQMDWPLSERGRSQADRASRLLAALDVDLVSGSDLERARTTAAIVAEACGCGLRLDARLREIHVGAWEGLPGSEVARRYPGEWERMISGEDIVRGGGESVAMAVARLMPAVHETIDAVPAGGTGVIVSHGASITAVLSVLLEVDYRRLRSKIGGLRNAHWARVGLEGEGAVLTGWNLGPLDERALEEIQR